MGCARLLLKVAAAEKMWIFLRSDAQWAHNLLNMDILGI
jgi:hypothetical protein